MARRRALTKKESERIHARRRAAERYAVRWNSAHNTDVRRQIKEGIALLLRKQSLRVSLYEVTLPDGQTAHVVYDRQRKEVVTLLPFDADLSAQAKEKRGARLDREAKKREDRQRRRLEDELYAAWCLDGARARRDAATVP